MKDIVAAMLMIACASSHAAVDWHWQFDQTLYTVAPNDVITVTATLFNNPSSDGNVTYGRGVGAAFTGDLQRVYDFHFGPAGESIGAQFASLDLPPGQSFPFVWGVLTPINGSVPAGTYRSEEAVLNIDSPHHAADNFFQVVVVPEPSTIGIMSIAGLVLFGSARLFSSGRSQ